MELEVLKKKISSYRTSGGLLTKVPDELAIEILLAWEQWTGPASGFYSAIGVDYRKMASVLGKAKKLRREGFPTDGFKEIKVIGTNESMGAVAPCQGIEVSWEGGKLIRFQAVDQLVEFLKKAA
jgi:hypothetical protein